MESDPLLSHLEMFEKWRDPMFIDTAHHHYRLRLEIDAFVGAASSRDFGRFMRMILERINIRWDSSGSDSIDAFFARLIVDRHDDLATGLS